MNVNISTDPKAFAAASPEEASLTRRTARFLTRFAKEEPSDEVRRAVALCLLDFLANCIAARPSDEATAILAYLERCGGREEAFQWGLPRRIAATDAAFGNAALGHSLIRDDIDIAGGSHFGVIVVPSMLAVAQRERLSGRALMAGILAGYEASGRLGNAAVKYRPGHERHFRPSGVVGAFGAAAGIIAALGPDEKIAVNALGFAADFGSGLNQWPWSGSQEIFIHAAGAARNGIVAYDLACAGLRASEIILEGRDGLIAAHSLLAGAAEAYRASLDDARPYIVDVRFKRVAGCAAIQSPIAAALALHGRRIPAGRIRSVEIRVKPGSKANPGCDYAGTFTTIQQSKMSLQYGVASALLFGRVDEDTYRRLEDPELRRLISCATVVAAPEFQTAAAIYPTEVVLTLEDGETASVSMADAPWLDVSEVEQRFVAEAGAALGDAAAQRLLEMAYELTKLPDSAALIEVLESVWLRPNHAKGMPQ